MQKPVKWFTGNCLLPRDAIIEELSCMEKENILIMSALQSFIEI